MSYQKLPSSRSSQSGIAHVLILALLLVVLSAVVFIGYKLYANPDVKQVDQSSGVTHSKTPSTSDAPDVKSTKDLDAADKTLDQNDPSAANSSDSSQLDSQTTGL